MFLVFIVFLPALVNSLYAVIRTRNFVNTLFTTVSPAPLITVPGTSRCTVNIGWVNE